MQTVKTLIRHRVMRHLIWVCTVCRRPFYETLSTNGLMSDLVPLVTYETHRQKTYLRTCAPSEDSDQPAISRSLTRSFAGRNLVSQGYNVSSCVQRRLLSDCADAQADLSLCWAHMSEDTFSPGRPRWLSWMRRPTGDQEVLVQPPPMSATFFRGD